MINDIVVIDLPAPVKHLIELVEMPTMPTVDVDSMLGVITHYASRAEDNEVAQEVAADMAYGEGLMGRNDLNEAQAMNLFNAVMGATECIIRDIGKVLGKETMRNTRAAYYDCRTDLNCLIFSIEKA